MATAVKHINFIGKYELEDKNTLFYKISIHSGNKTQTIAYSEYNFKILDSFCYYNRRKYSDEWDSKLLSYNVNFLESNVNKYLTVLHKYSSYIKIIENKILDRSCINVLFYNFNSTRLILKSASNSIKDNDNSVIVAKDKLLLPNIEKFVYNYHRLNAYNKMNKELLKKNVYTVPGVSFIKITDLRFLKYKPLTNPHEEELLLKKVMEDIVLFKSGMLFSDYLRYQLNNPKRF